MPVFTKMRESSGLKVFFVSFALFIDGLLHTVNIPMLPNYLLDSNAPQHKSSSSALQDLVNIEEDSGSSQYQNFNKSNYTERYESSLPYKYDVQTSNVQDTIQTKSQITENQREGHDMVKICFMFGGRALLKLISLPFVGPLINRIGYSIPIMIGLLIKLIPCTVYIVSGSYAAIFCVKTLEGLASALLVTAGFSLLAKLYPDDKIRGIAMAIAYCGLSVGVSCGPTFSGVMLSYGYKTTPYIVVICCILFLIVLQMIVLLPKIHREEIPSPSIFRLLKDPYILITAGSLSASVFSLAFTETSLVIWMKDNITTSIMQQGMAFLPSTTIFMVSSTFFGMISLKIGRWRCAFIGLIVGAASMITIAEATHYLQILIGNGFIGLGMGMVISSMTPFFGYLVDIRHTSVYGNVYSISTLAFCFACAVGNFSIGPLVTKVGYRWSLRGLAALMFGFSFVTIALRNPPPRNGEQTHLIDDAQQPVQSSS